MSVERYRNFEEAEQIAKKRLGKWKWMLYSSRMKQEIMFDMGRLFGNREIGEMVLTGDPDNVRRKAAQTL